MRAPVRTVLLSLALFVASLPASAAPAWVRVESPHFTVVSDAGEKSARFAAWQFEQVRAVLQRVWPWARLDTGRPVLVYAVKGEAGVRALAPAYWEQKGNIRPSSIFLNAADRHYIVVRLDVDTSRRDVNPYRSAYWSYIGIVLDATFPTRLPQWYRRGLAEVMSNTIVRTDDLTIGQIVPWNLERLQQSRMLLPQLTGEAGVALLKSDTGMELFDASAWALVHYLMFGERGANLPRFNKAATDILRGTDVLQAVSDAFGGLGAVTTGYDRYASQPTFIYQKVNVDVDVKQDAFKVATLSPAESAAIRALYLARSERPVEATALLHEARATAPELGLAYEVEGILADEAEKPDEAKAAYAKASAIGGAGFHAEFRLAWLMWPKPDAANRDAVFGQMVPILERSIAANPSYGWSRSLLAQALLELDRIEEAAAQAQRAVVLAPGEASIRLTAARTLWAQGRRDDAMTEAQKGMGLATTADERQQAQEFLAFISRATPTKR